MVDKKKFPTRDEAIEFYKFYFTPQTKRNSEVLNKAQPNEEIFVLREIDETSPVIIMEWIKENFYTASEEKLRSAFEIALRMNKAEDRRRIT